MLSHDGQQSMFWSSCYFSKLLGGTYGQVHIKPNLTNADGTPLKCPSCGVCMKHLQTNDRTKIALASSSCVYLFIYFFFFAGNRLDDSKGSLQTETLHTTCQYCKPLSFCLSAAWRLLNLVFVSSLFSFPLCTGCFRRMAVQG